MVSLEQARTLLDELPPVDYAFSYGSAVSKQVGYDYSVPVSALPMVDYVLVVDNSPEWHDENLARNPTHYSAFARAAGSSTVASLQRKYGGHIWYNTLVPLANGMVAKYGVIERADLLHELDTWHSLYTAGRLHKPVHVLHSAQKHTSSSHDLADKLHANLVQASAVSALLQPANARLSVHDLIMNAAGISYMGDPRMGIAENPRKVANIVSGNLDAFITLYTPAIATLAAHNFLHIHQHDNDEPLTAHHTLSRSSHHLEDHHKRLLPAALRNHAHSHSALSAAIHHLISTTAREQTLKGLLSAGMVKSIRYLGAKLRKRLL